MRRLAVAVVVGCSPGHFAIVTHVAEFRAALLRAIGAK
jgi:hypothetical protein